jgi:hypothetical protein
MLNYDCPIHGCSSWVKRSGVVTTVEAAIGWWLDINCRYSDAKLSVWQNNYSCLT